MKKITLLTLAALVTASAAHASLPQIDRDGDKAVSVSEFLNAFGPERGIEQFNVIDTDNDQVINTAEFWAATNGAGLLSNQ